ncbi:Uu.00g060390.m01.CDS01 [Anthostomella pinea]|uniref:Uu.00g060390.m01.CDS01 n=1 Tax=Anthostomella pinea TaxID=933095 RepID=A0AAI8VT31_9PEZI|nr:Uu.00g060390.m01.CDS01 [Anthostomella pinea]
MSSFPALLRPLLLLLLTYQQNPLAQAAAPTVASAEVVGTVADAAIDRDSCTSTKVGARELWTCRDSQSYPGAVTGFFWSSSASWTDFPVVPDDGDGNLTCYGDNNAAGAGAYAYFPLPATACAAGSGACEDGSRWVIWPDAPPLGVETGSHGSGGLALYTWIRNVHLDKSSSTGGMGAQLNPDPPASLYRADYTPDLENNQTTLPPVTLVSDAFWAAGTPAYGNYGGVVRNGTAYLYATLADADGKVKGGVALAKVDVGSVEDRGAYRYWDPATSSWGTQAPAVTDVGMAVKNAGTGQQGTFYYSERFGKYVWIGSASGFPNTDFYITMADQPEGPWEQPEKFYTGPAGTTFAGYSQQAHPGLSSDRGNGDDIYLTYTRQDEFYSTPLVHVVWAS